MARLRDRSTTDLLILLIAGTICFSVLASGALIAILAIVRPESKTAGATAILSDTINTLIGLLAGFLAGRTQTQMEMGQGQIKVTPAPKANDGSA